VQRAHRLPAFTYAAATYPSTELGPATWCVRSMYFCI